MAEQKNTISEKDDSKSPKETLTFEAKNIEHISDTDTRYSRLFRHNHTAGTLHTFPGSLTAWPLSINRVWCWGMKALTLERDAHQTG